MAESVIRSSFTRAAISGGGKGGKITVLAGACQLKYHKNKLKQRVTKLWISQKRKRRITSPLGGVAFKKQKPALQWHLKHR